MSTNTISASEPRKTPIQARSAVTVQAISEATIQVLLRQGTERLTTTRIAERAGVSVGRLYQYYPNKHSLLFAVLEQHLNNVAARVKLLVTAHVTSRKCLKKWWSRSWTPKERPDMEPSASV